jgi:vacuolar-type H+-ATPase subunit I/STV1
MTTPLSPEEIEGLQKRLHEASTFLADAHADLSRQLAETESWSHLRAEDIMALGKELGEARAEVERVTRERDEAYATVRRVWQALGCERYEDARGMHISELVAELRRARDEYRAVGRDLTKNIAALKRDRDRHKAVAEGERERCARVVDTPGEFPALRWKIAAAIRSLPTPTLPEESGDA